METTSYFQFRASFLTPATICIGVIVGPDGNFRRSVCPVARIFTLVPPMSMANTFIEMFTRISRLNVSLKLSRQLNIVNAESPLETGRIHSAPTFSEGPVEGDVKRETLLSNSLASPNPGGAAQRRRRFFSWKLRRGDQGIPRRSSPSSQSRSNA